MTGGPTALTAGTKVWMDCPELSSSEVDEVSGTEQIWMVVFSLLSTSTLAHPDQVQVGRRESRSLGDFEKVRSRRRRRTGCSDGALSSIRKHLASSVQPHLS